MIQYPTVFAIPKKLTGNEELVILPKRVLEELLTNKIVSEREILRWSREAKKLKKAKKLPLLTSLKALR